MKLKKIIQLNCIRTSFTSSDSYDLFHIGNEYLAVTNLAGSGIFNNDLDKPVQILLIDNQFKSCFWNQVYATSRTSIRLANAQLLSHALNGGDVHSLASLIYKGLFDIFKHFLSNNRNNPFHDINLVLKTIFQYPRPIPLHKE